MKALYRGRAICCRTRLWPNQLSDADRTFLTSADRLFSEILAREAQWIEGRASDPRVRNKEQLLEFYKQTFEGYQEYKKKYGDAPH